MVNYTNDFSFFSTALIKFTSKNTNVSSVCSTAPLVLLKKQEKMSNKKVIVGYLKHFNLFIEGRRQSSDSLLETLLAAKSLVSLTMFISYGTLTQNQIKDRIKERKNNIIKHAKIYTFRSSQEDTDVTAPPSQLSVAIKVAAA